MSKRTNFRNRKISIKQALSILRANEIEQLDEDLLLQNAAPTVESGVDKEEENETHLVAAMSSSHTKPVYIPTPDASRVVQDYEKRYRKPFPLPNSRIRFSATVEDCEGCPYSMDEQDLEWLEQFNAERKNNTVISEDAFEWIVQQLESTINTKQPFLSTAPDSILSYEELESSFDEETSVAKTHKAFAKFVYPHWRARRVANGGKPIMPLLRYEENSKDDGDPYVCFRRREVRQIRKTRQTGQSATIRLRNLRTEMQSARDLAESVLRREQLKREVLLVDQAIFEKRCRVKDLKRRLSIKGEDEDLVTHKRPKVVEVPAPVAVQRPTRPAARPENDSSLISLDDYFAERELKSSTVIKEQLEALKQKNIGWCDCTNNPYVPIPQSIPSSYFRSIRTYYVTESGGKGGKGGKGKGGKGGKSSSGGGGKGKGGKSKRGARRTMFRQRIGRGGRLLVDRRRMMNDWEKKNDRWIFDGESDPEDEGIEIDAV
ncbi:Enhancer of polycomb-like protein 1 [Taphrina deformans PYCC 5710]|uniref:Enhancer of polycomb-like protein n=1 Tax=Taphrina deformans (strain PYCC 5710 / ATCC 11124 / CBS 356.35 / IMI 108563 / JCM 9778 / NBRC 8474) TaxID=1097556 RepID=R4XFU4_TAPDE|nr:Enhancer of polycomb-like protein 1 [Taphrina deformans PYCC 5710]|eukprot:CCG83364.1 Enhancer of polycomb-like protein 1 [Taphrina deformans PYCC 5710]